MVLVAVLVSSLFLARESFFIPKPHVSFSPFYVGVECGYNNVTLCEALIDKVKNYTNLFIIGSTGIVENTSELNEVCDYAYNAGLHFSVYFSPIQSYTNLGENITNVYTYPNGTVVTGPSYPSSLPMGWLKNSTAKYGDRFLGAYVFDEPGGNQLDGNVQRTVTSGQTYLSTSTAFVANVNSKIQPYLNDSIMTYTADYGLYWFDYKAGYDLVLAELGLNNSRQLQVSLCRGAATAQNKDWGVMITYQGQNTQYLESGPEVYDDLVYSYDSGAKYAVVFDYAQTNSYPQQAYMPYEYGILSDEHFNALKNFWNYMQNNPGKHGSLQADMALVLPQAYGFGFRTSEDSIWGIFSGDSLSQSLWTDVNSYLNQYGSRLDIIYNDPAFNSTIKNLYSMEIQWSANNASDLPVKNLNSTFGYTSIQEAIDSGATSDGDVISVKAGVYQENLLIYKALSIVGEDKATTIIDGASRGTCVDINSTNVTISGFTIENSGTSPSAGIYLDNASSCTIEDNAVAANYYGIFLNCSGNSTLTNNSMDGNFYNFGVDGNQSAHFANQVDSSNTVNGKKIYYLIGENNLDINPSTYPDIGYLALVNCTGITVQGLNLSNGGNGILLVNTQNSNLTGNEVAHSREGIRLVNSEGNTLRGNRLVSNEFNFWVQGGLANNVDSSNTLNDKPVYYWINQQDKTVPQDAAYVALVNCSNITVQNLTLTDNYQSIVLSSTSNSTINQIRISNSYCGIELDGASSGNSISGNNISYCTQGIAVTGSNENNVSNNVLSNSQFGSCFTSASFNTLSENMVTANLDHGMQFGSNCNNNTVIGNHIDRNGVAVEFINSSGNTIVQNNLTENIQSIQIHGISNGTFIAGNFISNSTCGVEIAIYDALSSSFGVPNQFYYVSPNGYSSAYPVSSSHNVTQNTLMNNTWGILINSVNATSISGNIVDGGQNGIALGGGFYSLTGTINDSLTGNNVTDSMLTGIELSNANNCTIIGNAAINCAEGMSLSNSQYNLLMGNNVSQNKVSGIQLASSSGNTLRGNSMIDNSYGFSETGIGYSLNNGFITDINGVPLNNPQPQYLTNDVDASNTVNGKPVIYWLGQSYKVVPSDAACVILVNCTNITVQNLNLTGNYYGVQLAYTNNSIVTNNNVQGNEVGIRLLCSSYNTISGNSVVGNGMGISSMGGSGAGISLEQAVLTTGVDPITHAGETVTLSSTGNSLTENVIESNSNGVSIGESYSYGPETSNDVSGNTFYHNNFLNNTNQVSPPAQFSGQTVNANNSWDNGKEGNCWSNYQTKCPNATAVGNSGIGNTPYTVFANNTDHFPLMTPYKVPSP